MSNNSINITNVFRDFPDSLKKELVETYNNILKNYREKHWEPSELNGGKLCEVVYTILRGHFDGTYPEYSSKPRNMLDSCRAFEQESSSTYNRSVRIQIPRMLIALYEIRNNRGVGHVGGDVNPNQMDAAAVLYMSKWIMAELVRVFHNVDTLTAEKLVESITEKVFPVVWEVDGKYRVLDPSMSMKNKTLVLLYHNNSPIPVKNLFEWTEHSNSFTYKKTVLTKMHNEKLIEYNRATEMVTLSPKGVSHAEALLLNT